MLRNVSIRNFRSILSADMQLSNLTVLVGANGSGKSNVVKALQFISALAATDLETLVISKGGYQALVPKALPRTSLKQSKVEFEYSMEIMGIYLTQPSAAVSIMRSWLKTTLELCWNWKNAFPRKKRVENISSLFVGLKDLSVLVVTVKRYGQCAVVSGNAGLAVIRLRSLRVPFFKTATCRSSCGFVPCGM